MLVKDLLRMTPREIGEFIAIAIDYLDDIAGPCDEEEDDPPESGGDDQDYAWPEQQSNAA